MFQKDLLKNKHALITGGGTGLGKTMADRIAELGGRVTICGRRLDKLEETAAEIRAKHGATVHCLPLDVRDPKAIDEAIAKIWAIAPPNVLINNAAGNFVARSETLSANAISAVVDIVLKGSLNMTLACGKRWLEAKTPATVLSITTTYATTGAPYVLPSAVAKAGVLAMTRSLAVEWGGRGIRFVAVSPGPFPTPGAWKNLYPVEGMAELMENRPVVGRPGRHDEFGDLIAFLLSDQAAYIHGEDITIDGGNWLKKASSFSELDALSDADWAWMREQGKKS